MAESQNEGDQFPQKCKNCGQPAPHRTLIMFSNIIVTRFYTCSKGCMNAVIHEELKKGLDCIMASLPNHAAAECHCNAVAPEVLPNPEDL